VNIWDIIPELPLLRRELTELSSRRRTYVIRFLGAIVVLTIVLIYYSMIVSSINSGSYGYASFSSGNPNRMFGAGGVIFTGIVPILFFSVQLLMPALICGSITIEKERNTIGTLFVTRLTPMTIVLEKLGSRLVPMFTFLLLTFPVLAFVYSLGGVETTLLLGTMWLLFCECLLYASIGLLCSSWFATTVAAFIWSYMLVGLLTVFSVLFLAETETVRLTPFFLWLQIFRGTDGGYGSNFFLLPESGGLLQTIGQLMFVGATTVPSLFLTAIFVLLARVFLIRRAFVSSSSVLLKLFKIVDGFFTRLNDRTTGGVVLMKDYNSLPLFDPVAWRERSKKALGKARYLFRILVVVEGPTLFICVGAATMSDRTDFAGLRALLQLVWVVAAMILAMKGATVISAERVRETLEALLSTPLTAKEILTQKIAGMKRLMVVLAIPVLSVHFTLLLLNVDLRSLVSSGSFKLIFCVLWYAASCVLTTFLTMHILSWLAVLLGLRSQSQSRSAMTAICLIAGWVLVSTFLCQPDGFVFEAISITGHSIAGTDIRTRGRNEEMPEQQRVNSVAAALCCMMRPDGGIMANEAVLVCVGNPYVDKRALYYSPSRSLDTALIVSAVVFVWQLMLLWCIKAVTLGLAPRLLGRVDQKPSNPELQSQWSPSISPMGSEVIA